MTATTQMRLNGQGHLYWVVTGLMSTFMLIPRRVSPRWSQAREHRLPQLFATTRTRMFNGYGDQVASMYAGMDLKRNF
jgi:hypothetical protein